MAAEDGRILKKCPPIGSCSLCHSNSTRPLQCNGKCCRAKIPGRPQSTTRQQDRLIVLSAPTPRTPTVSTLGVQLQVAANVTVPKCDQMVRNPLRKSSLGQSDPLSILSGHNHTALLVLHRLDTILHGQCNSEPQSSSLMNLALVRSFHDGRMRCRRALPRPHSGGARLLWRWIRYFV